MECPACGLDVLVQDGAITHHLRPDTLQSCDGKTHRALPEAPKVESKAPAKATKAAPKRA